MKFVKMKHIGEEYFHSSSEDVSKLKNDIFDIVKNKFAHPHMREILGAISDVIDNNLEILSVEYRIDAQLASFTMAPEEYVRQDVVSKLSRFIVNELIKNENIKILEIDRHYGGIEYRVNMCFLKARGR